MEHEAMAFCMTLLAGLSVGYMFGFSQCRRMVDRQYAHMRKLRSELDER